MRAPSWHSGIPAMPLSVGLAPALRAMDAAVAISQTRGGARAASPAPQRAAAAAEARRPLQRSSSMPALQRRASPRGPMKSPTRSPTAAAHVPASADGGCPKCGAMDMLAVCWVRAVRSATCRSGAGWLTQSRLRLWSSAWVRCLCFHARGVPAPARCAARGPSHERGGAAAGDRHPAAACTAGAERCTMAAGVWSCALNRFVRCFACAGGCACAGCGAGARGVAVAERLGAAWRHRVTASGMRAHVREGAVSSRVAYWCLVGRRLTARRRFRLRAPLAEASRQPSRSRAICLRA